MADNVRDFWPDNIGETRVVAPVTLMRTQAAFLSKKTNGLLEATVITRTQFSRFSHHFHIRVPALDDYTYELFLVMHDLSLYPAQGLFEGNTTELDSEGAFTDWLKAVLWSEHTQNVISSLLSQIES